MSIEISHGGHADPLSWQVDQAEPVPWQSGPDQDRVELLNGLLDRIPSVWADVLQLYCQGLTQREIGAQVGLTQPGVSYRLRTGREALRWAVAELPDLTPGEVERAVRRAVRPHIRPRMHQGRRVMLLALPATSGIYWREWSLRRVAEATNVDQRTARHRRDRVIGLAGLSSDVRAGLIAIRDRRWFGGRPPWQ